MILSVRSVQGFCQHGKIPEHLACHLRQRHTPSDSHHKRSALAIDRAIMDHSSVDLASGSYGHLIVHIIGADHIPVTKTHLNDHAKRLRKRKMYGSEQHPHSSICAGFCQQGRNGEEDKTSSGVWAALRSPCTRLRPQRAVALAVLVQRIRSRNVLPVAAAAAHPVLSSLKTLLITSQQA